MAAGMMTYTVKKSAIWMVQALNDLIRGDIVFEEESSMYGDFSEIEDDAEGLRDAAGKAVRLVGGAKKAKAEQRLRAVVTKSRKVEAARDFTEYDRALDDLGKAVDDLIRALGLRVNTINSLAD